ncbi:MAG: hypothetical protein ACFB15_23695 [Cyclobacteriaceae bacterium]
MIISEASIAHLLANPAIITRFAQIAKDLAEKMLAVIAPINTLAKKKRFMLLQQWQQPEFGSDPMLVTMAQQALGLFIGENFDYKDLYDPRFVAQAMPMIDEMIDAIAGVESVDEHIVLDPLTMDYADVGTAVPGTLPMQKIYYQVDGLGATKSIFIGGVNGEVIQIGQAV